MKKTSLLLAVTLFFLPTGAGLADTLVKPYTFTNDTIADADEVNANFDAIINQLNKFGSAITIDRSGNTGIGTSRPEELLDLAGKDKDVFFNIDAGLSNYSSGIRIRAAGALRWAIMFRYSESNNLHIRDEHAGTDMMTFQFKTGRVGINNTDPGYALDIDGDLNFSGDIYQNGKVFSSGSDCLWSESSGDVYRMSGSVGIGTASPAEILDLTGIKQDAFLNIDAGSLTYSSGIRIREAGSLRWAIMYRNSESSNLHIRDELLRADIMTFQSNTGKVGLGKTPGYNLDVAGYINSDTGYKTGGKDYAEYFKKEESLVPGDIVGINLDTGNVRKYRSGDELVGIVSDDAGYIGNNASGRDKDPDFTLVGLLGQLDFDETQTKISGRIVSTKDGKKIGILLSNGKVFIK